MVQCLTVLFHIPEVPSSNLGPETNYPEFLRGRRKTLQANAGSVTLTIRPRPLPARSAPSRHSLITPSSEAI
jgi:hypothetical protein